MITEQQIHLLQQKIIDTEHELKTLKLQLEDMKRKARADSLMNEHPTQTKFLRD